MIYNSIPKSFFQERFEVWQQVEEYLACGLNVIPLHADGTRKPRVLWKQHKTDKFPYDNLKKIFLGLRCGIACICGVSSGNLEVLDFDDPSCWEPFWDIVGDKGEYPIVETPSGGFHVYWRCSVIETRLDLAKDENDLVRIETSGQDFLAVMPGGDIRVHASGLPYKTTANGNWQNIPTISPEQRRTLLEAARTFDLRPPQEEQPPQEERPPRKYQFFARGIEPWRDFDCRGDWYEILRAYGWSDIGETGDITYWRRPDKEEGISATTGKCVTEDGIDMLYVFSSNAAPFDGNGTYTKSQAWALLAHGGDFKASNHYLADQGYGYDDSEEKLERIMRK